MSHSTEKSHWDKNDWTEISIFQGNNKFTITVKFDFHYWSRSKLANLKTFRQELVNIFFITWSPVSLSYDTRRLHVTTDWQVSAEVLSDCPILIETNSENRSQILHTEGRYRAKSLGAHVSLFVVHDENEAYISSHLNGGTWTFQGISISWLILQSSIYRNTNTILVLYIYIMYFNLEFSLDRL